MIWPLQTPPLPLLVNVRIGLPPPLLLVVRILPIKYANESNIDIDCKIMNFYPLKSFDFAVYLMLANVMIWLNPPPHLLG